MIRPAAPRVRWFASPVVRGSAAVHLTAAAAALHPHWWPWSLAAVTANHGVLTAAGLWPRSRLLGTNWTRLPSANLHREVAITIDDGPDPAVTPRVLDVLTEHDAHATFFCIGERVLQLPELAREIVRRGHCIENHSLRHRHDFSLLGPATMRKEIENAQRAIADTTGREPLFFRAPAGLRNPFLQPLLESMRLQLASWTRRGFDTVTGNADTVYRRLTHSLTAGDILLLHDGNAAADSAAVGSVTVHGVTADTARRPVILSVLPRLLTLLRERELAPITLRAAIETGGT